MAQQKIDFGAAPDGAGGDNRRVALEKLQANDDELYGLAGSASSSAADAKTAAGVAQATAATAKDAATVAQASATAALLGLGYAKAYNDYLINGSFDFWQRGTSFPNAAGVRYTADRWCTNGVGGSALAVSYLAFTVGQAQVPGNPAGYLRATATPGGGAGDGALAYQLIENVSVLAGKTVTLTFWAKADTPGKQVAVEFSQAFGAGGSTTVTGIGVTKVALTASWAKYTVTVTLPSIAGLNVGAGNYTAASLWLDAGSALSSRTGGLGHQSITLDLAKVRLADGAEATDAPPRPAAIEYLMCCRYFQLVGSVRVIGYCNGNALGAPVQFFPMRQTPSAASTVTSSSNVSTGASNITALSASSALAFVSPAGAGNTDCTFNLTLNAELQ
ncbi:carbohydrate binding domain-containing protein [Dyella sp.]|uniref:carbohydrate binding domain-containing protein n=1 Tax=Dyella sp. TaxID=1869338 RepID=UPI00284E528D|nr:carbohydrate binding domain-containing protein [Dyella sp.]MDR3446019.1 carbohydrate binding domain-containing protein [Dyella sp.]